MDLDNQLKEVEKLRANHKEREANMYRQMRAAAAVRARNIAESSRYINDEW